MAIFHHNYGVSEFSEEHDGLLHKTISQLKDPVGAHETYPAPHGVWKPTKNLSIEDHQQGYETE